MEDFDLKKNTADDRLLLTVFENERPLSAAQVAMVLRELDSIR